MAWKYITQDIIDAGGINVTSAEMFAEAREYNIEAVRNYNKKRRNHWLIALWSVGQFAVAIAIAVMVLTVSITYQTDHGTVPPTWLSVLRLGGFLAYVGATVYFVIVRRDTRPLVMTACALPVLIASWKFLGIPALDLLVGWLHQRTENELKNKSGYPAFSRLAVTTSQSDSDSISNITFDSIREKARREQNRD